MFAGDDERVTDRQAREPGTAGRILDVAERLVQLRGFNGFSYADVAAELGITKASLHYHFPGKAELGEALIPSVKVGAAGDRERRVVEAGAGLGELLALVLGMSV